MAIFHLLQYYNSATHQSLRSSADLTLHCKDKNHDLGEVTISFKDLYSFKFTADPWAWRSLYFCSFWWSSTSSRHYYDVYVQKRDKCHLCIWTIYEDGPCDADGFCYPWNRQPQSKRAPLSVFTPQKTNITQPHHL
ncbi:S-protein homolog 5-like [Prosopis cineraria]|uniref:S-protein homolog 5-like n=1 Tax=Prosopis cineraria TaxID=364024 RepID=UPI00240EC001|nr:S-protein homolog 5-like [Prosopis cineraria]